ncbi:MAG: winged helix-turn-helix transcriptional regulator, partial [Acidobacteriota bacterium]|nr:winged helix-turn-helix transcriptional regulator [Acidobacteriota bacterium]
MPRAESPSPGDYRSLAEFRYLIRRFLRFSEETARAAGIEPRQHQVLLAIKGLPPDRQATIGTIAERMQIQPHSAVEIVDRLEARRLVRRRPGARDRRQVLLDLTPEGEEVLKGLSVAHRAELQMLGPTLVRALNGLLTGQGDAPAEAVAAAATPAAAP